MGSDPCLFSTPEEAEQNKTTAVSLAPFVRGDDLCYYLRGSVEVLRVENVRMNRSQRIYDCTRPMDGKAFALMHNIDDIFHTRDDARLHIFKLDVMRSLYMKDEYLNYVNVESRFQLDELIFDSSSHFVRCGLVMEIRPWPTGGGYMYVCRDRDDPTDLYLLHSDDERVFKSDLAAINAVNDFKKSKFHVDQLLHDVDLNLNIVSYKVFQVDSTMYNSPRYDTRNLETGFEATFYASDNTIFHTLAEARHYKMKKTMEEAYVDEQSATPKIDFQAVANQFEQEDELPLSPKLPSQEGEAVPLSPQVNYPPAIWPSPGNNASADESPKSPSPKKETRKRKPRRELRMLLREQPKLFRLRRK